MTYVAQVPTSLLSPSLTMHHLLPGKTKIWNYIRKKGKYNWLSNFTIYFSPFIPETNYFLLQPFMLILNTKTIEIGNAFKHRENNSFRFSFIIYITSTITLGTKHTLSINVGMNGSALWKHDVSLRNLRLHY